MVFLPGTDQRAATLYRDKSFRGWGRGGGDPFAKGSLPHKVSKVHHKMAGALPHKVSKAHHKMVMYRGTVTMQSKVDMVTALAPNSASVW